MKNYLITFITVILILLTGSIMLQAAELGDLNDDGKVDIHDCIVMAEYIVGANQDVPLEIADLNGDGQVAIMDLILLAQYIVGEIDEFPVEEEQDFDRNPGDWVFDHEYYFIFNVAVGGLWPGYPDETTSFPQQMKVDYIRVFDRNGDLEWNDEFEGSEINNDYWTFEVGNGHENGIPGWGNEELQYYTENDNAWIEDDTLILEAREESVSDQYGSYDYTSTRMITQNKVDMKYGRVEIKAKMPEGQGIWPALWMLGNSIEEVGWPDCGEIDIMEYLGNEQNTVHGTVHGPGYSAGDGIGSSYKLEGENFSDDFNIFILEWEEDEMRWYVNDEDEPFHKVVKTVDGGIE